MRHFTQLSERNFAIDNAFYPLGSCTMKYNPKVNDEMAALPGFRDLHPDQPVGDIQGALALLHTFEHELCEIVGMDAATFCPGRRCARRDHRAADVAQALPDGR